MQARGCMEFPVGAGTPECVEDSSAVAKVFFYLYIFAVIADYCLERLTSNHSWVARQFPKLQYPNPIVNLKFYRGIPV